MQPIPIHDPAFPRLAQALDPIQATFAFETMLAETGYPVRRLRCSIERARLKPGRKALIGYRLTGEGVNGLPIDQRAMLILWPEGDSRRLPPMGGDPAAPLFGPAHAPVDRLLGDTWLFPNDRKVHHIAALLSETPIGLTGDGATREVLHYVPEQGCTVRLKTRDGQICYGKCRADDRGRVAARVAAVATEQPHAGLRLATMISHDPERRIIWQKHVSGRPLDPADACARAGLWAGHTARAIAAFHRLTPPDGLKSLTVKSIARTLAGRVGRSVAAMPALASDIAHLGDRLESTQPTTMGKLVLSHCDLHPANLLWDGTSFALIDLDTAALAPAAMDYGSLVASIVHAAIEAQARDHDVDAMIAAFRLVTSEEIGDARTFNWFVAASLMGERLYRCGTRMKSPALHTRLRLVETANRLLLAVGGKHG